MWPPPSTPWELYHTYTHTKVIYSRAASLRNPAGHVKAVGSERASVERSLLLFVFSFLSRSLSLSLLSRGGPDNKARAKRRLVRQPPPSSVRLWQCRCEERRRRRRTPYSSERRRKGSSTSKEEVFFPSSEKRSARQVSVQIGRVASLVVSRAEKTWTELMKNRR